MKRYWLACCCALVLAMGCGQSKGDDDSSPIVGGMGGAGQGAAGASGGHAGDAAAAQIAVLSLPGYPGFDGVYTTAAYFAEDYSSGCDELPIGPCRLYECSATQSGGRLDAGDISLASPQVGYEVTLRASDGAYVNHVQSGVFFSGGETISASAPGNTAPPFELTVQMPLALLVSSPALDASAASSVIRVRRSADLAIVWSRGAPGVRVQIQGSSGNTSVLCTADSTLGQLTIPAAVLDALDVRTMLLPMTVGRTSAVTDGFETDLVAAMGMYTPARQRIDFELE